MKRREFITALTAVLMSCCAHAADMQFITEDGHGGASFSFPLYGTQADTPFPTFESSTTDETVVVPFGETITLAGDETALDILNYGTLIVGPHTLTVRTLTNVGSDEGVNPDGTVCECCSTQGRTHLEDGGAIVTRNLPFDAADTAQAGVGILNLHGGQTRSTSFDWRAAMMRVSAEMNAGDATIQLEALPRGWRAGDTLIVPDTRQPTTGAMLSEQTEVLTISDIDVSGLVTLSAPLQFDHHGAHGIMPEVGCPSQPITIRSEDANGIRGHMIAPGHGTHYLYGVQFQNWGRTTFAVKQPGVNQPGREAVHWHHSCGHPAANEEWQGELVHCSVSGAPNWGCNIHNSFFMRVEDCCFFDCRGAAIVSQQVHSYGGAVRNNFICAKTPGSGQRITDRSQRNDSSITADHWHDRVGLGLGSVMFPVTGNRMYCCKESVGVVGHSTTMLYIPKKRGVHLSSHTDKNSLILASHMGYVSGQPKRYPFLFDTSGNQAWGGWRGIELWTADTHLDYEHGFDGLTLIHCRNSTDLEDQQETVMRGWRILGDYSSPVPKDGGGQTYALNFKPAYRFGITAIDCEFKGHGAAYNLVNDGDYTRFERCTFDCPVVNWLPQGRANGTHGAWEGTWDDCTFIGDPVFADGAYPKYDLSLWLQVGRPDSKALLPTRYFVRPWKDGIDYQVFHYEQHPDWEHRSGDPGTARYGDLPAGVWTQRQLIELGTPIFGDAVPPEAERWGQFYAAPLDCCEIVPRLRELIRELEQGN